MYGSIVFTESLWLFWIIQSKNIFSLFSELI
jgi:hypothetical protein